MHGHGLTSLISISISISSHFPPTLPHLISSHPFPNVNVTLRSSLLTHSPTNVMGRPPGNGGPAFRFTPSEVSEMESILLEYDNKLPPRDQFATLAEKFSNGSERFGKSTVQMKQVMNWFQNKRYAIKAKSSKATPKLDITPLQAVPPLPPSQASVIPPLRQEFNGKALNNVEFEARSVRDGAWYDVAAFLSIKNKDTDDPEVLVRFVGLTSEEDEWIKVSKHVRHRSLPCEASECVAVLPGDLILCFQEAPEQALYFDAHVLDAQRLKHDSRTCHCRFLVRYDHDLSEESVSLRKICRRPETDYRLQIYQALRPVPQLLSTAQPESVPMNEKLDVDMQQKAAHGADDIPDQGVPKKKARVSNDDMENPEAQITVTQNAAKEEATDDTTSTKVVVAEDEDHTKSSVASVEEGNNSTNNAAAAAAAAMTSCQNQTNGHNNTNAGSSGSPVGAQHCF